MQTFVTRFGDGHTSHDLDSPRLGKQRLEALQILKVLTGESTAWQHHPAVNMWRGYEMALCSYGSVMCLEWFQRGYKDTLAEEFALRQPKIRTGWSLDRGAGPELECEYRKPPWRWNTNVLISHRSNLIRKMPDRYAAMYPDQKAGLPYLWPIVDFKDPEQDYILKISNSELKRIDSGWQDERTMYDVPNTWDINPKTGQVIISE